MAYLTSQYPERARKEERIAALKSGSVKAVAWVGSLFLTGWAIVALSHITTIPSVLVFFGWLVVVGSWTSPDGTTYEVGNETSQSVVSWLFIIGGSFYVFFGKASIWMDVVTAIYWLVLFARFTFSKK